MKKLVFLILIALSLALITAGFLTAERFQRNPEQIVPYPYQFETKAAEVKVEAPILIVGDRMGSYFAKFQTELSTTISVNLANSIKVQSIAREGYGLHRSLHELRSLIGWPQILIYQGGSEEFSESKFNLSDIEKIKTNFKRYNDDRLETLMILYPWLSRLVYEPIERVKLPEAPIVSAPLSEADYLKRLDTDLLLYEQQLIQLAALSKDRNSLLILVTTPINLDIKPHRTCEFTSTIEAEKEIIELRELLKTNNPKEAYARSSKLVSQYVGNASLYFLHGQIARRLGRLEEAKKSLLEASAYDCEPWRATEIHNSIIRKVAKNHQVILFDFAQLMEEDYNKNTTFFDDFYPQNLYYDQGMQQLGLVIKSILKL